MVAEYCDEQGGFIIRTAAEGVGEAELASDAAYLKRVWTKVMERKKRPQTRYQLYGELALAQRVLRDFADAELDRIRVDSRLTYEALPGSPQVHSRDDQQAGALHRTSADFRSL